MNKKVFAISGSTRTNSTNLSLIKAIATLFSENIKMEIYEGLAELPHFNPDLDNEAPPETVVKFRLKIAAADAVLICTPEYAMGTPGSLKNAIDWTVSSCEFSGKPVALITASSMGEKAHQSLLGTLKIIEADIDHTTQLLIPFVKTKVNSDNIITDPETQAQVENVMNALIEKK